MAAGRSLPDVTSASAPRMCPSSPASPGSVLLGIIGPSGRVGYLTPPIRVGEELLADLQEGVPAEQRMRFADECQTTGCAHWSGQACGLIDRIIASVDELPTPARLDADAALPKCSIRNSCRWFAQRAGAACAVCPLVVTARGSAQGDDLTGEPAT